MFALLRQQISHWFTPRTLGQRGERAAARFLRRLGYTIVARNVRLKTGELDIVAVDNRTVVFVEVKTWATESPGHPADAVDADKQQRISRLALIYLKRHGLLQQKARFDVVAVRWPPKERRPQIEHIKNAFEAVGDGQMFS